MKPASTPGRRSEFEALYERHGRAVWAVAFARWLDAESARDVMQESFLRLWREWEAGQEIQNPRAWLIRVARNLAEDTAKSSFRRNGTAPPELFIGVRSEMDPDEVLRLLTVAGQLDMKVGSGDRVDAIFQLGQAGLRFEPSPRPGVLPDLAGQRYFRVSRQPEKEWQQVLHWSVPLPGR